MSANPIDMNLVNGVIKLLPSDVQDFVQNQCTLTLLPSYFGGCNFSKDQHILPYMIIYHESGKKGSNPKHIIAHEIAHAFLGHNGIQGDQQKQEVAAELQVKKWGLHTDQIGP